MKKDLDAFRVRERHCHFPNNVSTALRVTKPLKARVATAALQYGVSESQLVRFLVAKGLEQYGIDGLAVL